MTTIQKMIGVNNCHLHPPKSSCLVKKKMKMIFLFD